MKSDNQESRSLSTVEIFGIVFAVLGIAATIIWTKNPTLSGWVAVIAVIVIVLLLVFIRVFKNRSQSIKEKLFNIQESLDDSAFLNYWTEKIYIPMDITLDPEGNKKRVPLFNHLVSLINNNKQFEWKYICLMGDTGSGKTDALVHFLIQYVKRYSSHSSMPSQIRLYTMNMGYSNLLERIQEDFPKRRDRKNCILLLDALDECKEAQMSLMNTPDNNPSLFMEKLAVDTQSFTMVVVSCRKQFFMREEFNPDKTSIAIGNPLTPDPFLHWKKLYLAPFSDEQVEKYLNQRFSRHKNDPECKEASRIVFSCKDLFLRPLILSHIDIVLEVYRNRREPLCIKDIYDAIVFYWIQREAKNNENQINKLLNASMYAAIYMYKNHLSYLDEDSYKTFCKDFEIDDADNLLRVKSLLNNNKNGYKFFHQSFFEYFLAYWFFLDSNSIDEVRGLDFVMQIYWEIYNAYKTKKEVSEIERQFETRDVPSNQIAAGLGTLANRLSELHQVQLAELFYQEAVSIQRLLAEKNPDDYILNLPSMLHNLANLHTNTHQYDKAEEEYQEALFIYRQLAEIFPDDFLKDIANILNDIAIMHVDTHHIKEAEAEYQEALNIRRQLAITNPDAFLPDLISTLNNLAILHRKTKQYDKAEAEYQEALTLHRQLTKKNPDVFMPKIAAVLNNLAILHEDTNFKKAEAEFQEALSIRRQLAKKNPDVFCQDVAGTLNNIALLHCKTGQYDKAEAEFQEALKIHRQLAETFEAFLPDVAATLRNMAILDFAQDKLEKALTEAKESAEIFKPMAEKNPEAYENDLKKSVLLAGEIAMKIVKKMRKD